MNRSGGTGRSRRSLRSSSAFSPPGSISRQGGLNGPETPRRTATLAATSWSPGGQGAASAAPATTTLASLMLYSARMAQEARLQLLSAYENIELAQRVLAELCGSANIDEETTYWVGMALREALANAIKHGNKLSSEKRVLVHMLLVDGQLQIEVEDEGEGFDPASLEDPTSPGNLLRSSGRGVFYMHQFMDEVNFRVGEQGGTRVELIKNWGARRES